ncbi:uncharacterized protein LOC128724628 [Anopheles nili]|uniref:uncharacterized protein LOC128724628 n=1 Tax=Anopheles nili TaxID=185578 RepID=UPI00237C1445|nr:uncharacterized protein LOC128724628 [Anopheles nili]
MGEVGANATETTAPADSSSGEPKENGEVNGTESVGETTTTTTTAAALKRVSSDGTRKDEVTADSPMEASAADNDATEVNDEGASDTEQQEQMEETTRQDTSTDMSSVAESAEAAQPQDVTVIEEEDEEENGKGEEKEEEDSKRESTVAPSSGEKSPADDADAGTIDDEDPTGDSNDPSNRGGVNDERHTSSHRSEQSKQTKGTTKRDPAPEIMDVDDDEVVDIVPAHKGSQNGAADGGATLGSKDTTASKRPVTSDELTEVEDEELMEEDDGDDGEGTAVATNGHKEARALAEDEADDDEPVQLASDKTIITAKSSEAAESEQEPMEEDNEDEDDDDKPVSINSDSESDRDQREQHRLPNQGADNGKDEQALVPAEVAAGKREKSANTTMVDGGATGATPGSAVVEASKEKNPGAATVPSNGVNSVTASNQNGDCDGDLTILSDKEDDCVLIEDDDDEEEDSDSSVPSATPNTSIDTTPNSGSRRSAVRSRRSGAVVPPMSLMVGGLNPLSVAAAMQQHHQALQQRSLSSVDDDDDIEEIIDDPLTANAMGNLGLAGAAALGRGAIGPIGYQGNAGNYKGQGQKSLLVNNAAQSPGGKEPTLVIIDTNTLMNNSGNGRASTGNLVGVQSPGVNSGATSLLAKAGNAGILPNVNSPVGQFNSRSLLSSPGVGNVATVGGGMMNAGGMLGKANVSPLTPVTPLLPALTDDMFVLEAPSFIVPYIYEKPPVDNLRDIVDELEIQIKEMRKKLEESGAILTADKQSTGQGDVGGATESGKEEEKKDTNQAADSAETEADKSKYSKKRKRNTDEDEEWDELDTSTDDEASDEEQKTKVLIKEAKADIEAIKEHIISPSDKDDLTGCGSANDPKKSENYFENPLGKFFMNIGINLVQEFVQSDLLRQQKRKRDRESKPSPSTQLAINSLMKNLEQSKENNKPYKFEMKRCEYCPFKSESALVMAHHYETPHMRNFIYKCNFCAYETRPPHDILYHMEAVHNIKGRMEKALSYHHCPNCPFEDNGKSKLARHAVACAKKFRPELNLNPPIDWEPPAKIPRIKPKHGLVGTATAYQAMTAQQQKNLALANQQRLNQQQVVTTPVHMPQQHLAHGQLQQQQVGMGVGVGQQHLGLVGSNAAAAAATLNNLNLANLSPAAQAVAIRARAAAAAGAGATGVVGGRAPAIIPSPTGITAATGAGMRTGTGAGMGGGVGGAVNASALASAAAIRNTLAGAGMVMPNNLQLSATALAAAAAGGFSKFMPKSINAGRSLLTNSNASITIQNASSMKATKTAQPPSISITPLPRQSSSNNSNAVANMTNIAGALSKLQAQGTSAVKPGQNPSGGKTAFVVCEICDGYIKDLDQLRNHMQWIHKVKIHPKMIYNRPPLNCQKCQYRFFTDQGLERHLLGSHGLVTSSMQEAANKGKDAGRCPVCGRVYQWKLLNHVSRDHNMTLKPAHLSYKCTVCTATFGMYKQFESHVYSAHSTVAKKTADGKGSGKGNGGGGGGGGGNSSGQQQGSGMGGGGGTSSSGANLRSSFGGANDSLLKPLKINDEITIIPQPTSNSSKMAKAIELESHVID